MSRINSNIPSLLAQANLGRANQELELRLERLSTGLRINRGADDPAGLIITERIRSDIEGVSQGIRNAERASSVIATTEGALTEVSDLLNSIRALVVEGANTGAFSDEELAANQSQIDSAIDSITRIANTATFGGLKLLNGSLDYNLSGVNTSAISRARVNGASFIGSNELEVNVDVVASAQVGALYLSGTGTRTLTDGAGVTSTAGPGAILSTTTLRVAGSEGVTEVQLLSGTSFSDLVKAVNNNSSLTGVEAELINPANAASGVVFKSSEFGSSEFVSVERLNNPTDGTGTFRTFEIPNDGSVPAGDPWSGTTLTASTRDTGRDVAALVNGTLATGRGLNVTVNSPALSLDLLLAEDLATDPTAAISNFYITGGGALFQLGPDVTAQQQTNVGVQSVAASLLGGTLVDGNLEFLSSLKTGSGNSLDESKKSGDFSVASDILESAIDEISILRGRLGAFEKNVLQTNVRSLQAAFENLSASASQIRDADFALETSQLTRAQILSQSTTQVLGIANQQSQQVLSLLG